MRLKVVSAVLAVAGGVWMLYLFLSFSQVQYSAFPITEPFYVKCNPLGRPGITPPDLDDSLTPAQRQAVDTYVSRVHEENASENEGAGASQGRAVDPHLLRSGQAEPPGPPAPRSLGHHGPRHHQPHPPALYPCSYPCPCACPRPAVHPAGCLLSS
ncbi:hypothetical protein EV646_114129 [Kribbella antiqua]|uniref:Uncharacterized protein n=1 Tax=Kribbella antiqua TaxID=2512217 RepID=A0A4R2IDQ8_9ACTN|nr:hypothetical protein [Kribbella antiqua]TCO42306.1 hypothetical protein EV646_114129 [Kribbella antiqua]